MSVVYIIGFRRWNRIPAQKRRKRTKKQKKTEFESTSFRGVRVTGSRYYKTRRYRGVRLWLYDHGDKYHFETECPQKFTRRRPHISRDIGDNFRENFKLSTRDFQYIYYSVQRKIAIWYYTLIIWWTKTHQRTIELIFRKPTPLGDYIIHYLSANYQKKILETTRLTKIKSHFQKNKRYKLNGFLSEHRNLIKSWTFGSSFPCKSYDKRNTQNLITISISQ